MEKYQEYLQEAVKSIRVADHILYITYPVIKDKRLLLKSLDSIYDSVINMINAILQYDYIWKRIQLSAAPKENLETFINKCSRRYNIPASDITEIMDLFSLVESHKKAPIEFARKEKIVIMAPNLSTTTIDVEKSKKYLSLARRIFEKVRFMLNKG